MKNLFLFSIAALSLVACKGDDDTPATEVSIIGTWKENKHLIYDGKTNTIINTENLDACESKSNLILASDKSATWNLFRMSNNECKELGADVGTYSYDTATKNLSFNWTGNKETDVHTVTKLTANELEFIEDYSDFNNDGVDDIHTILLTR